MDEHGGYVTGDYVNSIEISGDYAYIIRSSTGGLAVMDVSDPTLPVLFGSYTTEFPALQIVLENGIAYVRTRDSDLNRSYLNIINVNDPSNPVFMDRFHVKLFPQDMDIVGSYMLFAAGDFGLMVYDLENGSFVGSYSPPLSTGYYTDVRVVDGIAYTGSINIGMELIDFSNPTNPVYLGSTYLLNQPQVIGDTLYAIQPYDFSVYTVDVSDPTEPILLGSYETPFGIPVTLEVRRETVFVSYEGGAKTEAYDFIDPNNPELLGVFNGFGYVGAIGGDRLYIRGGLEGLKILDASNMCTDECVADFTGDFVLDFHDISVFLTFFNAGALEADLTNDGGLDFFDISAFLSAFAAGCP